MGCVHPKKHGSAWTVWLFFSLLVLTVLVYFPGLVGRETLVIEGVGRAALAGGTVGRQALTASVGHGLLPGLIATVLAWIVPPGGSLPWSALLVTSLASGAVLCLLVHYARRDLSEGLAFCLALAALCAPPALRAVGHVVAVLAACLGVHTLFMLARWQEGRAERYLVGGALFAAGTLLCGIDTAGWMLTVMLGWTFSLLLRRATLKRFPGLLLLMFLPVLYFTGVWMLLNSLIMGDAGYFLQALPVLVAETGLRPTWDGFVPETVPSAAGMLSAMALVLGLWRSRGEAAMFGFGGLAAWGWVRVQTGLGADWTGPALDFILLLCGLFSAVAMARWWSWRHPALAAIWALLPVFAILRHLALAPWIWQTYRAPRDAGEKDVPRKVEQFVLDKCPKARIFVGGYDALALLGGERSGRLQAVIDLHPDGLRKDYWGQELFLLLRRPEGKALMDNVFVRFPNLYEAGLERTLYAGDWGAWRLFELVLAPSPRLEGF